MMKRNSRRVASLADAGTILVLDDGSSWLIQPDDLLRVKGWKPGARVAIGGSPDPEKSVRNLDNAEEARAVYAGQR